MVCETGIYVSMESRSESAVLDLDILVISNHQLICLPSNKPIFFSASQPFALYVLQTPPDILSSVL
jgi:hypothetical protein